MAGSAVEESLLFRFEDHHVSWGNQLTLALGLLYLARAMLHGERSEGGDLHRFTLLQLFAEDTDESVNDFFGCRRTHNQRGWVNEN
jgi:hypothetical protein